MPFDPINEYFKSDNLLFKQKSIKHKINFNYKLIIIDKFININRQFKRNLKIPND